MRVLLGIFIILICFHSHLLAADKNLKVLVLIICSDHFPGSNLDFPYKEMQNIWKSYMHSYPEQIEAYFLRAEPNLVANSEIRGDVIWSKTDENVFPGILNKTLLAIEYMLPKLNEFDYVLRTNLSSFFVFPAMLEFLKTIPRHNCYCGSGEGFGSGSGFFLSTDVAKLLVQNKSLLFDRHSNDDVLIGIFLREKNIYLYPAPRIDVLSLDQWNDYKCRISPTDFHFRIKNLYHERRFTEDLRIYSELLDRFYPK
jgi:hypothetical protein